MKRMCLDEVADKQIHPNPNNGYLIDEHKELIRLHQKNDSARLDAL
jgi:hypothetical protein